MEIISSVMSKPSPLKAQTKLAKGKQPPVAVLLRRSGDRLVEGPNSVLRVLLLGLASLDTPG